MKPTINRSRLIKEAHRLKKYEGIETAIAFKLAWISEKKKFDAELDAYRRSQPAAGFVPPTHEEVRRSIAEANIKYYADRIYTAD